MTQSEQLHLIKQVHKQNAITAILYALASTYQDIVVEKLNFFPLLLNYGDMATGKSQLTETIQLLNNSKLPGIIFDEDLILKFHTELFKSKNKITFFDEYHNGSDKGDAILKGVWDRAAFQKGNSKGKIAIVTAKIENSLVVNSNVFPKNEGLISRLIVNNFKRHPYTEPQTALFEKYIKLKTKGEIKHFKRTKKTEMLIQENFLEEFNNIIPLIEYNLASPIKRVVHNYAVLGVFYNLFFDKIKFPFSELEMIQHFDRSIKFQLNQ